MTRAPVAAAVALLVVFGGALPAGAVDLDELFERSRSADYAARQMVACVTPAGVQESELAVSQVEGILTVRSSVAGGTRAQVAPGGYALERSDGEVESTRLDAGEPPVWEVPVSYQVMLEAEEPFLGRPAQRVAIYREETIRSRMILDLDTGAILKSETLNDDGSVYCTTEVVEFTPVRPVESSAFLPFDVAEARTLQATDPDLALLPLEVAGFRLVDAYEWDDAGGTLAYYEDGFFSFAVIHGRRPFEVDGLTSDEIERTGGSYTRSFGSGWSMYVWETERGGMALYGDLPLDLQEKVIDGLPPPNRPGFLTRLWRRLFG